MMKRTMMAVMMLWACSVFAEDSAAYLQSKLNAIRTLSASFKQVVKAKQRNVSQSSGSMALSRPGHFRWQTKDPMQQLVVADGSHIWVYDMELEQVSVKKQSNNIGGAAALFLSSYNDAVARDFTVSVTKKEGVERFDLRAKSHKANFDRVTLEFTKEMLRGIELYDQLGQHTDVRLSQVKVNPKLSASLFEFKVPKGVDVVRE